MALSPGVGGLFASFTSLSLGFFGLTCEASASEVARAGEARIGLGTGEVQKASSRNRAAFGDFGRGGRSFAGGGLDGRSGTFSVKAGASDSAGAARAMLAAMAVPSEPALLSRPSASAGSGVSCEASSFEAADDSVVAFFARSLT